MKSRIFLCVGVFVCMFCQLLIGQTQQYYAIMMNNQKSGHAVHMRTVGDETVTTTFMMNLSMVRGGMPIEMSQVQKTIETLDGKPLSFETVQDMSLMSVKMSGKVDDAGTLHITVESMGQRQKKTMPWPEGAVLNEGARLIQQAKGLQPGTQYTVKTFSPEMMQVVDAQVTIGPKKNIDLFGRIVPLTEVKTALTMPGTGSIIVTDYVNSDFESLKNMMPVAGMQIELIACEKEFALSDNELFDAMEAAFIASPVRLENLDQAASAIYIIRSNDPNEPLHFPEDDNQNVETVSPGTVKITIQPAEAPKGIGLPIKTKRPDLLAAMKPTMYIQSDDPNIMKLAKEAVGSAADAATAARNIESFVANYITNQSLGVGYASAVEVMQSRQGDCSEFAVLTAALCRAAGIPAQVVTGIAYIDNFGQIQHSFGGHAWNRVRIGRKWICLDAAFKSGGKGYNPGHIALAFGSGDPSDFFKMVASLGKFKIEKVALRQ